MEFNNTALTADALIQNCESLCKLGNGGISGNSILMAKFTGYLNQAQDKVALAILTVDKNWRFDDFNYTTPNAFPIATKTLTDGVRDYILPRATNDLSQSTLWKVYKVRLKDINGDWYDLIPLSADENEIEDSGKPTHYRLIAGSVRLSGPPSSTAVTLTAGIQVWFQRSPTRFTTAFTTQQPGFMSGYHFLLALDASATFLLPTDTKLAGGYITLYDKGLENLKNSYAQRNDDPKTTKRMVPFIENTE